MRSDDRSNLLDIYEAAKLIRSFVMGIDRIDFEDDLMRQSAIIRQLDKTVIHLERSMEMIYYVN